MKPADWQGVFPAITTPFAPDLSIDHVALHEQVAWLVERGCHGIVTPGSLGEAAVLSAEEKVAVLQTCRQATRGRVPLVASVSALSTADAVAFASAAQHLGCDGLMVLPPYVYRGTTREMESHVSAIFAATSLSCMLYNNPIAYGTDYLPEQIVGLGARHPNLHAVKESSGDIRRITGLRAQSGPRFRIFVGMDDVIVEGIAAGAVGWIAGLVNALPEESIRLFDLALDGPSGELDALYAWFLPLLRLDTVPTFVQLIKLVQQEVGRGTERVRPPRLPLEGEARASALALIRDSLARRPASASSRPAGPPPHPGA